ncbi:MAG TPA: YbjN domain-containing protein, partial [Cellulomonas sp.]
TTDEDDMGFFTKPEAAAAGAAGSGPAPLTHQRIIDLLDSREMRYGVDDHGNIGGSWDGHLFFFFRMGGDNQQLQVRGRWNRKVGADQVDRMVRLVNDWNAEKLWPKGYVRVEGEMLGVYAEHTVGYSRGLTDEQLDLHLACGITTGLSLFEHLDEAYPDEAAVAKAEDEKND